MFSMLTINRLCNFFASLIMLPTKKVIVSYRFLCKVTILIEYRQIFAFIFAFL